MLTKWTAPVGKTERAAAERWSEAAKRQVEDVDQALADALGSD
jgi:hypothetical protein